MYKFILMSVVWLICSFFISSSSLDAQLEKMSSAPHVSDDALKKMVKSTLNSDQQGDNDDTRITVSPVVSTGKSGAVIVVYVTGDSWCGSGGCTLLILEPLGASSFRLLGRLAVVQLPVWLLSSETHGYPDIGVGVRGGNKTPIEYEAKLMFDGVEYPGNPSLPPAQEIPFGSGKKLISSSSNSIALYGRLH